MKTKVKVGIIQMTVLSDLFDREIRKQNVEKAIQLITELCEKNEAVDAVVLPEEFYSGFGYGPISMPDDFQKVTETVFTPFGEIAKKYNTHIIGGLLSRMSVTDYRGNNIGFVIGRDGKLIGYQERFHQNLTEANFSFAGTKYEVFDLDFGKVGIVMGLDLLFPEISRNLVVKGAELLIAPILSPGSNRSTTEKYYYFNELYTNAAMARAHENQAFVVMVNGIGQFAHIEMGIFGESTVAGPLGKIYQAAEGETAQVVELDLMEKIEANKKFPIWDIRKSDSCLISA